MKTDVWLAALLTGLFLVPVWGFTYFPSQDGPSHLYNASILRHWNDPRSVFPDYYELDLTPVPNWLATALLYCLLHVVTPLAAEKLLLTLFVVSLAAAWWYWLTAVQPLGTPLVLAGPLLSSSFFLYKGFYSFCLGLSLFLLVIGTAWRHRREPPRSATLVLYALLVPAYFAHLVCFGVALALAMMIPTLQGLLDGRRGVRLLAPAARLSPLALLAASSLAGLGKGVVARWDAWSLLGYLSRAEWLVFFSRAQLLVSCGAAALVGLLAAVAVSQARHRKQETRDVLILLACCAFTVALYFAMPRGVSGGWHLSERLAIFPFLLIAAMPVPSLSRGIRISAMVLTCLLSALQLGIVIRHQARLDRDMVEYLAPADSVAPHGVLLGLRWPDFPPAYRFRPMLHAVDHYALRTGGIDLGNHQARTEHFQVRFREDVLAAAPPQRAIESDPGSIDMGRYAGLVDYLITWRMRQSRDPAAVPGGLENYEVVSEQGRVMVLRRRDRLPR